jgi:hypothetical protein
LVASRRRRLAARDTFLAEVSELEAWLGRPLEPPARPSDDDAEALSAIIPRIRQPEASIEWTHVAMAPGAKAPHGNGPFQFAMLQPLHVRLFGREIYLGMEWVHFPEGRVVPAGDGLAIVPVGETGAGTLRLAHPDEVPPEAARPG